MTLQEFLEKYEQARQKYTRVKRKSIRYADEHGFLYCPLTLVCYEETKRLLVPSEYVRAGDSLELAREDIYKVVIAADEWGLGQDTLREKLL